MTIRDIVSIALFAAFIAALGFIPAIPLPVVPVPITAQLLGVILAGAILGAKRGFLANLLFLILVAAGLPLLSGGRGGISAFFAPSTGYLISFPFTAYVIGYLSSLYRSRLTPWKEFVILAVSVFGISHSMGIIWLAHMAKLGYVKALISDLIFVPGDVLKIVIACLIVDRLRKALPDLMDKWLTK